MFGYIGIIALTVEVIDHFAGEHQKFAVVYK